MQCDAAWLPGQLQLALKLLPTPIWTQNPGGKGQDWEDLYGFYSECKSLHSGNMCAVWAAPDFTTLPELAVAGPSPTDVLE